VGNKINLKILFIVSRNPLTTTVRDGGVSLSQNNLECLSSYGEVQIFSILPNSPSFVDNLIRIFLSLLNFAGGLKPTTVNRLNELISESHFDLVFIDNSLYGRAATEIKRNNPGLKIVCHFHNVEYLLFKNKMNYWLLPRLLLARSAWFNESEACKSSDTLICLTTDDLKLIGNLYKRKPDLTIPICLKHEEQNNKIEQPQNVHNKRLLFCGSFYSPNISGINWFIENVLPKINYELDIVGYNMERAHLKHSKKTNLIGSVKDLRPFYEQAAAVINPVFSGGGMKTKTIEALKFGKAIFGTSEAFRGIEIPIHLPIYKCEDANSFIKLINTFQSDYKDESSFPEIYNFFETNFSNRYKIKAMYPMFDKYELSSVSNIGAVVTSHNPPDIFFENITQIAEQALHLVIVDNNSDKKWLHTFNQIEQSFSNVTIICNHENKGVGAALNQGVAFLLNKFKVEWVATFDHDTLIPDNYFEKLSNATKQQNNTNLARIIGPNYAASQIKKNIAVEALITSGMVIHNSVFNSIGYFREDFFIDSIDHEFCLRANSKGITVYQAGSVAIDHKLGNPQKIQLWPFGSFFILKYSPIRKYYMFRNFIFLFRLYFKSNKNWLFKNSIFLAKEFLKTALFERNRQGNFAAITRGMAHGITMPLDRRNNFNV